LSFKRNLQRYNMGGFFATLLKKVAPMPGPEPRKTGVTRAMAAESGGGGGGGGEYKCHHGCKHACKHAPLQSSFAGTGAGPGLGGLVGGVPRPLQEHRYVHAKKKVIKSLAEEWEMDMEGFTEHLTPNLFTRSEKNRALIYLSPGIKDQCIDAAGAARIKCVWSGVKVWEKRGTALGERGEGVDGDSVVFPYRLTQEGAVIVARHAGDKRRLVLPARDLKQLLKELGTDIPLKSLTPAVSAAARAMTPGSCIVELKIVGGGGRGGGGVDEACPPIAVELTTEDTLRVEWRYRRGLEGAPKSAAAAILRHLDTASGNGNQGGYDHGGYDQGGYDQGGGYDNYY
jgi:tRNA (cytosine34-C5)-methyltransferase